MWQIWDLPCIDFVDYQISQADHLHFHYRKRKGIPYTKQCTKKICIIFALPFFTCMVRFFFCYISGLFYQGGPPVIMVRIFFSVWTKLIYNPILLNKRLYSHTVLLFTLVLHEKIHLSFNVWNCCFSQKISTETTSLVGPLQFWNQYHIRLPKFMSWLTDLHTFQPFCVCWVWLKPNCANILPVSPMLTPKCFIVNVVDRSPWVLVRLIEFPDLDPNIWANINIHMVAAIYNFSSIVYYRITIPQHNFIDLYLLYNFQPRERLVLKTIFVWEASLRPTITDIADYQIKTKCWS